LREHDPRTRKPVGLRPIAFGELLRRPLEYYSYRWMDGEGFIRKMPRVLDGVVCLAAAAGTGMVWQEMGEPRGLIGLAVAMILLLLMWLLLTAAVEALSTYDLMTWQRAPGSAGWVSLALLFFVLPAIPVYYWLQDRERAYLRAMKAARGDNWRSLSATPLLNVDLAQYAVSPQPGSIAGTARQFGVCAVVLLVLLRLTIGWHFFYEGMWKIEHADTFSAEPFLTQAKGPLAPLFYWMIPDIDGRQRLQVVETEKEGQKVLVVVAPAYLSAWDALRQQYVDYYGLTPAQAKEAKAVFDRYKKALEAFLAENGDDIISHFQSLDRFHAERRAGNLGADFQKQRVWDRQQELRTEVNGWLTKIDAMGESYHRALWEVLDQNQKAWGPLSAPLVETQRLPVPLPFVTTKSDLLNLTVTLGLAAIGLCLILGFCNRLAALGGAAFLTFVVMTQWPWPTVYPPTPEVVGHALFVDKNFVELMALLALAALPVGRWGGLDELLYRWFGRKCLCWLSGKFCKCKCNAEGK